MSLLLRTVLALVLLCGLSACDNLPVAQDLSQQDANQIVAVLTSYGIRAETSSSGNGRGNYVVGVQDTDYTAAISILNEQNLPARSRFNELVQQHGLIPNSRELESLRVDHARSVEIEEMLQTDPAVYSASVVVRQASREEGLAPGIAVMLRARPGQVVDAAKVREMILPLVPGATPEAIVVSVFASDGAAGGYQAEGAQNRSGKVIRLPLAPFIFGLRVVEDDYQKLAISVLALVLGAALLAALLGYSYANFRKVEQGAERLLELSSGDDPADKQVKRLPEI